MPATQSIPPSPVMSPLALSGMPQSQAPFLVLSLSKGHSSLQSGVPSRSLSVVQSSPPAPPLPDIPALPLPPLPPVVPPVPTKLPALPEPLVPLGMIVVEDDPPVPVEPPAAAEASFLLTTPGSSAEQPRTDAPAAQSSAEMIENLVVWLWENMFFYLAIARLRDSGTL